MPTQKMVNLHVIENVIRNLNEQLAKPIPQYTKATLATMIESLLSAVDCYDGFGYLYWRQIGHPEWENAGCPEATKESYIIGHQGAADKAASAKPHESHFTSDIEGEYSRFYFFGETVAIA